ncbi:hypothetical protein [Methylobacterium sp. E-045]|uniref:hypothetical protein n=1 Tax=Methylobacterium sp. E-045 TaxID=2836575 RepID=UPI001FB8EAE5|nr:hypothetical protein [Methylobacterium sp. E-045]MCJ2128598.1 hypothetical protein [Methylobacterium sp. E-045]
MSSSKRPRPAPDELIEDAILYDILASSEDEIAAELREVGSSPDEAVATARRAVANAEAECGRRRLAAAKRGVAAFRSPPPVVSLADVQRQRTRLDEMKRNAPGASGMMMAARKSEGLSKRDEEGLLDDLADLERLEREDDEGSER